MTTPHSELSDRGQLGALNDKPCLITYLRRRSGQCNEGRRPGTKRVVVVPLGLIAVQSAFVTCVINAAVTMSPIIGICSFTFILTRGLSSHNPRPPTLAGAAVRGLFILAPGAYFGRGWHGARLVMEKS